MSLVTTSNGGFFFSFASTRVFLIQLLSFFNMQLLDDHVAALCDHHGITRLVRPGRGRCRVKIRVIRHPPIEDDEMAYFVALHEVGHAILGVPAGSKRLEREAWCWDYALRESLIPPHYSTLQRIAACLLRYLARAQENGWYVPESGSAFWRLLRWWD